VRQSTKTDLTARGFHAFLPCRAAAVAQDPHLRVRDHPPAPDLDRVALAGAEPGQQALLVLAYLRKGETFAEVAAGFGVGTSTAWRYVNETVALLAARAPRLRQAVRDAAKAGHAYVVLDGTLIPVGRVAADRPFYSGKHKRHGMNLQVIASPEGDILWVSGALPGSVHDKKAEWIWGVLAELEAAGDSQESALRELDLLLRVLQPRAHQQRALCGQQGTLGDAGGSFGDTGSSVRGACRIVRRADRREGRYREHQGAHGGGQRRNRRPLRHGHRRILEPA
jgi:Helix-turn-helix of DDE superfamily endonuclease/DDE superfamily endonuclease